MSLRRALLVNGTLLLLASVVYAHDLFLKLDTYFVQPRARVAIPVLNGTFLKSEGAVAPERIADISVGGPGGRTRLAPASVWTRGPDSTSLLSIEVGATGTSVVGVSVKPRELELAADAFNAYLEEDGIGDVLEARRRNNELGKGAKERYSKHVKAVFQVGEARSDGFSVVLGYPAEIVPLENPYAAGRAAQLRVRCLVDGRPAPNQTVQWGGEQQGRLIPQRSTRTDSSGVAVIALDAAARWYVKFIHMVPVTQSGFDYESKWATLTFETR